MAFEWSMNERKRKGIIDIVYIINNIKGKDFHIFNRKHLLTFGTSFSFFWNTKT